MKVLLDMNLAPSWTPFLRAAGFESVQCGAQSGPLLDFEAWLPAAGAPATLPAMAEPKRVLQAALELAPGERADLLEAIAASLDGIDLGPEWEDEIRRRTDDLDAGRVQAVPGEAVLSRLEQHLRVR